MTSKFIKFESVVFIVGNRDSLRFTLAKYASVFQIEVFANLPSMDYGVANMWRGMGLCIVTARLYLKHTSSYVLTSSTMHISAQLYQKL